MSLTGCLQKAKGAIHPDDKAAIIARSRELRGNDTSADDAARQAVQEQMDKVRGMLPAKEAAAVDAAPVGAPATPGKVENFGEVLPPSRRTKAAAFMATLTDGDIAAKPLSEIWPLSENEAIEDKFAGAVAHAARAEVPAKPRKSYALKQWVAKVKTVRELAQFIVLGNVTREQFIEKAKTLRLEGFMAKVALLEAIDRAQWKRIGDVREAPDAGRYEGKGPDAKFVPNPSVFVVIDDKKHWLQGSGSIADHIDPINMLLGNEAEAKRMAFEVRGSGSLFGINKKGDSEYRRLKTFPTAKEATDYRREHYDELVKAWEDVKARDNVTERDLRSDTNKDRIGPDHRNGRDITGEEFDKTFGFKGGEFGKWVSQGKGDKERQWMLNRAYDAFMDLAELVGIPPRAVSLNGTLGIAFGSRGSGWASAHFEPSNLVINLTKTRGAGALAHEWFHALDNYFARLRGGEVPMSEARTAAEYRKRNYVTYKAEPLMVRKDGRGSPLTKSDLERMRAANPSSGYLAAEHWHLDPKHPAGVRPEVEARFSELVQALNAAPMTQRARMIDKGEEGYWSQIIERAARSFEAHVIGRLAEQGRTNEYLANVTPLEEFSRDPGRYPYPTPDEIKPVAEAFDNLFGAIETRDGDDGNTIMFSAVAAPEPFYSELSRQVEKVGMNAGPATSWKAWLKGLTPPPEVAAEIGAWLDAQDGKIAKQAVQEFVREKTAGGLPLFTAKTDTPVDAKTARPETAGYAADPNPQHRHIARKWQESIARGNPAFVLDAVVPPGARTDLRSAAAVARGIAGHKVIFVRQPAGRVFNGSAGTGINATYVLIDVDSNQPVMAVLGHELLHRLRATRPDLYDQLHDRIALLLRNESNYQARILKAYADAKLPALNAEKIREELIADIFGDEWSDPEFWHQLGKDQPTGLRAIVDAVAKFLDDLIAKITRLRPFGTEFYLSDLTAARAAVLEATREFSRTESDWTADAGEIKFSAADPTDTAAFKRWFGDSKVVDAEGKPLVVYHGTSQDFSTFRSQERYPSKKLYVDGKLMPRADGWDMGEDRTGVPDGIHYGAFTDALTLGVEDALKFRADEERRYSSSPDTKRHLADLRRLQGKTIEWRDEAHPTGDGFYFSPAPSYSVSFSGRGATEGGQMMPVYLSIKNPIYLDAGAIEVAGLANNVERYRKMGHDGAIFVEPNMFGTGRLPLEQDRGSYSAQIVAFDPEQIKSAIGNRGTFDAGSPDIRFSVDHTPEQKEALARAGLGAKRGLGETIRSGFARAQQLLRDRSELASIARQATLDQFHGIDRAVKAELGGLPVDQDPYVAARLANGGTSGVMRALLLHGQAEWSLNRQHLQKVPGSKGLLEILQPLGTDLNDWFGWMIGNRAARLKTEGREHNLSDAQIKTLQGLAAGKEAQFRKVAGEYAAFKRSVLDVAEKAGLIDADGRKVWDNADYIPFYRQIDDKATFSPTGKKGLAGQSSGIRMLKGGESALNDPMENLLMNFSRLIDASLKNNAIRKTVAALAVTDLIQKVGYDFKGAIVPKGQVKKTLMEAGTPEAVLDVIPDEAFEGMAKMWAIQAPTDPDVVRVMANGHPTFYKIGDPLLLKALTSFVPFDFPGLFLARGAKRVLTRLVTSTPEFMLRNWIRDSMATQAIAKDGFNPAKSLQGIVKSYTESGAYEPMLFAGASFQAGNVSAADPSGTAQSMRRALRKRGLSAIGTENFLASVVDTGLRGAEHYFEIGEAIENANREAVYEATQNATGSATAAAYEAKDLMDFNLRGSSAIYQVAADVLPFFNARVQGLYRLGRSDPKRLAVVGGMILVMSLLLAMANDGQDWYEELEDWDKDTYWHFKVAGKHFRLPKPFEIGAIFASLPERLGRRIKGLDTGSKTLSRAWALLRDQLAFDPVPQIVAPAYGIAINKDRFRDRKIENIGDEGKLPHARFSSSTSDTARVALGATAPMTDKIGLSPKDLEYLVNGYFGTVGMYALAVSDMVVRKVEGKPPGPALRLDDLPVLRAFYREDPARSTVFESDLYKLRDEADKIAKTIKAYQAQGEGAKALKLLAEESKKAAIRPALDTAAAKLGAMSKARDKITNDPKMTPDQKRQAIDALQTQRNALTKGVMTSEPVRAAQ